MRVRVDAVVLAVCVVATLAEPARAQTLGTFRWQLRPYCNVLTLTVRQQSGVFTLDGTDDQCGAGRATSAAGLAFLNADGTVGFGLTAVPSTGGAVHVTTAIDLRSLSGTWQDSLGSAGPLVFTPGAGTGGPPRPFAPIGIPPGSINTSHLAASSVGTDQLALNAVRSEQIVDRSLTAADLFDGPRVAASDGGYGPLTSAQVAVRAVTITAPRPGRVIVNASGVLGFLTFSTEGAAQCSITTGTQIDPSHLIVVSVPANASVQEVPFAATRGFDVPAGPTQFNIICTRASGDLVAISNTTLTAIFAANGS